MKKVIMFYLEDCPHCKNATKMIRDLQKQYPRYKEVKIEKIEESKNVQKASNYDYYYVPTFYVDGVKIHEGVPTLDKIEDVLNKALEY